MAKQKYQFKGYVSEKNGVSSKVGGKHTGSITSAATSPVDKNANRKTGGASTVTKVTRTNTKAPTTGYTKTATNRATGQKTTSTGTLTPMAKNKVATPKAPPARIRKVSGGSASAAKTKKIY